MENHVEIIEVSPRDGIQNEKTILTTEQKVQLIQHALDSGFERVEVTSFVNPKKVPQMFDTDQLIRNLPLKKHDNIKYIGLALNEVGFKRAVDSGLDIVNYVVVASDNFSIRNQGATTLENLRTLEKVYAGA